MPHTSNLARIASAIDALNNVIGHTVSWLAIFMVLVEFGIVAARNLLDTGNIAVQESVMYMYAFMFMLGAGFTLNREGHVRVDVFYQKFNAHKKALVNLFGALFLLIPTCVFIFMVSFDYVASSWSLFEGSREAGGLDLVYVLKTAIPAMAVLLCLQAVSQVIKSLCVIANKEGA